MALLERAMLERTNLEASHVLRRVVRYREADNYGNHQWRTVCILGQPTVYGLRLIRYIEECALSFFLSKNLVQQLHLLTAWLSPYPKLHLLCATRRASHLNLKRHHTSIRGHKGCHTTAS